MKKKPTMSHMSIIIRYRIPKYEAMAAWTTAVTKTPDTFAERYEPTNLPRPEEPRLSDTWGYSEYW